MQIPSTPNPVVFSTLGIMPEGTTTQIISVINSKLYEDSRAFQKQVDHTLALLQEKAQKLGAVQVVGIQLVPTTDFRGICVMMAYGTAILRHG